MAAADAALLVATILARVLLVLAGLAFVFPALMASDAGTPLAVASAYVLLASSLCLVLAGAFGKWSLLLATLCGMILTFLPIRPEAVHTALLSTVVPIVMIMALLYAFGCLGGIVNGLRAWCSTSALPEHEQLDVAEELDDNGTLQ